MPTNNRALLKFNCCQSNAIFPAKVISFTGVTYWPLHPRGVHKAYIKVTTTFKLLNPSQKWKWLFLPDHKGLITQTRDIFTSFSFFHSFFSPNHPWNLKLPQLKRCEWVTSKKFGRKTDTAGGADALLGLRKDFLVTLLGLANAGLSFRSSPCIKERPHIVSHPQFFTLTINSST